MKPIKLISALVMSAALTLSANAAAYGEAERICWGLGAETDSFGRPLDAVKAQERYADLGGEFVGSAKAKHIRLTFDEGYENGYTEKILDVLKEKNAPAVFFVTYDYARDNPELIKRMIAEGHTVGNHTLSHPSLPDCSDEEIKRELSETHDYVKESFGYDMYVMRPPKGEFSERVLRLAKDMGYTTVLWSFAYYDWDTQAQPEPSEAFDKITSKAHSGEICLLHAVSKTNTEILGKVIDDLRGKGYVFMPM